MELRFEHSGRIGQGTNPNLVQKPDGTLMLFWLEGGRLVEKSIPSEDIDFSANYFDKGEIATSDDNISNVRIQNVPRVGIFGVWTKAEDEDYKELQRFAIYEALSDVTRFLESGRVTTSHDNAISSISLSLKNPNGILNSETKAQIVPGMKIELMFSMGDSDDYPMGVFYVDRTSFQVGGNLEIDGRNLTGKLLRDQQFNDNNKFDVAPIEDIIKSILEFAGIDSFDIEKSDVSVGVEFPHDMDLLDGIRELISIKPSWIIAETLDGRVLIGNPDTFFPLQSLFSKYEFNRDDLISRGIVRDDVDVYSKVSVSSDLDTYYIRTQPFYGDGVLTAKEKCEEVIRNLKEIGVEGRVETSDASDARYRVFIGHFGELTINEAKEFMSQFDFYWEAKFDTKYNMYYIVTGGVGNAYGLTGHQRATDMMNEIQEKRKELELQEWYMRVEMETDRRKWHRLWIGHFSKTIKNTLEPAMYWMDTNRPSIWYEIYEDKMGWVIRTGGFEMWEVIGRTRATEV